ncbi:MAG: NUDIX hydrolase [Clostridiales bacterium]|nr:MAG: NUDIX hydrolase [Clostridiales bacterium]
MKISTSAGGVVFLDNTMLLLMKTNGDWVLPKGRIEQNEHRMQTALREVLEEADVKAIIHEYLGTIHYEFYNTWRNNEMTSKTVHWYLMTTRSKHCYPQREEGFKLAKFIAIDDVLSMVRYDDERKIVKKAIALYREKYLNKQ